MMATMDRTKEHVYDEEIFPLMQQILAICETHQIPVLAHFAIPTPTDPDLCVTSALLSPRFLEPVPSVHQQDLWAALSILKDGFIAYTRRIRR